MLKIIIELNELIELLSLDLCFYRGFSRMGTRIERTSILANVYRGLHELCYRVETVHIIFLDPDFYDLPDSFKIFSRLKL